MARVYHVFSELAKRKAQLAGTMSGGRQQMLAIGHALMARPRYLLIDEMSLGLAPLIVKRLASVVAALTSKGIGVLVVEQFVEMALGLAAHVVVLRRGEVRLSVHPDEVRTDRTGCTRPMCSLPRKRSKHRAPSARNARLLQRPAGNAVEEDGDGDNRQTRAQAKPHLHPRQTARHLCAKPARPDQPGQNHHGKR